MSVIVKAIVDRQSEIERLQAEMIKTLNDVDKSSPRRRPRLGAPPRSGRRLRPPPVAETQPDAS